METHVRHLVDVTLFCHCETQLRQSEWQQEAGVETGAS